MDAKLWFSNELPRQRVKKLFDNLDDSGPHPAFVSRSLKSTPNWDDWDRVGGNGRGWALKARLYRRERRHRRDIAERAIRSSTALVPSAGS